MLFRTGAEFLVCKVEEDSLHLEYPTEARDADRALDRWSVSEPGPAPLYRTVRVDTRRAVTN